MITVEFNAPGYSKGFGGKWFGVTIPPLVGDIIQGRDEMAEKKFLVVSRYWREATVLVLGITEYNVDFKVPPPEGEEGASLRG